MRDTGFLLGFPSLVLVACVLAPVIGFVIRRKWRLAVARKEEIKRLLVLAAEEAARAELEVSSGYGVGALAACEVPISTSYHECAVCYSPTTTRCARCKVVRYCSGKCQIIHWRQGHKEGCYPPGTTQRIIDVGSKVTVQDDHKTSGSSFETEGRFCANPSERFPGEPVYSSPGLSPDSPSEKIDDKKSEFLQDSKGTSSDSETSSMSFSGLSTSTSSGKVSDDVSEGESTDSNESQGSDVHLPVNNPLDIHDTISSVKHINQSQALSPKFASLVYSVDSLTKANKLNQTKPNRRDGESVCASTSSLGLGSNCMLKDSIAEPRTVSAGFWGTTLDSIGSKIDTSDNYVLSNSHGVGDSKLSDSGSVLSFSFSLSETTPLHAQDAKVKGIVSDDAFPCALRITKSVHGAAVSENICADVPNKNSSSLNEGSTHTDNDASCDSHSLKCIKVESMSSSSSYVHLSSNALRDSISSDASNVINLPSSSSERLKHDTDDPESTSHILKSRGVRCLSSSAFDVRVASSAQGQSVPVDKSGKVDGVQASAAISSCVRSGLKTSVQEVADQFRGSKLSKHCMVGDGCEVSARYTDKGIFPYELFVKLNNWNTIEFRPCGLINCGNSCYANAVLQCLAFTPPLTAYFLQGLHSKSCVKKEGCFTCEFESLILKAREGNSPLSPIGILGKLQNIGNQLGNGREEDAHEFLRYAIDTMQSVCLKEARLDASGPLEEETTLIGLTFGGYLRSKIKCTKCQGKSERQERMMDLTVGIEGDIETLEEALHQFTDTEILDGENKYRCSRCKSYERAKKKLTITEAPNILTIALKRFQSGKFGKLNKPIQFPEILDLAPFISGTSDKSPIYRLYGVVVHLDVMNASFSGHYVCYVKNVQNKWFKIDDSTVTPVELKGVLTKGAYMLLYARSSPRVPCLIRNKIISWDPRNKAIPSWISGKNTISKSNADQSFQVSIPPDSSASFESFNTRSLQLQRIPEEDSSSDSSSLLSNSDEGSCGTDSTRDSTSTDELSDFIFGESGQSWNSPSRSPDSNTSSSSSSPCPSRHSPTSYSEPDALDFTGTSRSQAEGSVPFLHPDTTRHCRKLVTSSSCRETESQRLGSNPSHDVNSGISFKKSMRERRD
ncbi:ubiquitin carboxyl-terminal hydrolase 16-like [Juglans microcarpa x Juglans regia]|uniref:ubiquitin carboxyl-terminal hydrolase 16-like n=1 Tax=Juglans microcarpa x Juglans regia TaxID=2249226 RepID=UPI001B7E5CAA|nr:ubiquitin carboxyl-terminal hydrolase 16-like [Juglans microcarpa x Juglans regia]